MRTNAIRIMIILGGLLCGIHSTEADNLIQAIKKNNAKEAIHLVQQGADLTILDEEGRSALWWAVLKGNFQLTKLLLERGSDQKIKDIQGQTLLTNAVLSGSTDIVNLISRKQPDDELNEALLLAAQLGSNEIICVLVNNGADLNAKNSRGLSPLLLAAGDNLYDTEEPIIRANREFIRINNKVLLGTSVLGSDTIETLIYLGADVNFVGRDGTTPLIQSIIWGDTAAISILLEAGADVNATRNNGETALSEAIQHNKPAIVYMLLQAGASPNFKVDKGISAIHLALKTGDLSMLRMLLEAGADPNAVDDQGRTALMLAAMQRSSWNDPLQSTIRLLLEFGADVNIRDFLCRDALSYAFIMDEQMMNSIVDPNYSVGKKTTKEERIRGVLAINNYISGELVRAGADISGWLEWASLLKACAQGDISKINDLFVKGADINRQDAGGLDALRIALSNKQVEVAKLLIKLGADINNPSKELCDTPLSIALAFELDEIVPDLFNYATVKNSCYLSQAIGNKDEKMAIFLVESGFGQSEGSTRGHSPPLNHAVRGRMVSLIHVLLKAGADVNETDYDDATALMEAAELGYADIVEVLIESGADVTPQNRFGISALNIAQRRGDKAVIEILIKGK